MYLCGRSNVCSLGSNGAFNLYTPADAINNAAGFGFNGYNLDGSPRWDLISNLRIQNIEVRWSSRAWLGATVPGSELECLARSSNALFGARVPG